MKFLEKNIIENFGDSEILSEREDFLWISYLQELFAAKIIWEEHPAEEKVFNSLNFDRWNGYHYYDLLINSVLMLKYFLFSEEEAEKLVKNYIVYTSLDGDWYNLVYLNRLKEEGLIYAGHFQDKPFPVEESGGEECTIDMLAPGKGNDKTLAIMKKDLEETEKNTALLEQLNAKSYKNLYAYKPEELVKKIFKAWEENRYDIPEGHKAWVYPPLRQCIEAYNEVKAHAEKQGWLIN